MTEAELPEKAIVAPVIRRFPLFRLLLRFFVITTTDFPSSSPTFEGE